MGVFSKRRKEDFISSKQPWRPFTDWLASPAISQCWGPGCGSSLSSLCLWGSSRAAELSEARRLWSMGRGHQIGSQAVQKTDEPELWRWGGDEVHKAIFIPLNRTSCPNAPLASPKPPAGAGEGPQGSLLDRQSFPGVCLQAASRLPPGTRPILPASSKCPPCCWLSADLAASLFFG